MAKKIIGVTFFIFVIFLFCYFRLKPLYFQSVGYTYDQGRDFLKAAEIVQNKDLTFIGPTTGIPGLFHGAWYYYLLTIPFIISNGAPIGFYYFNFFLHLLSLVTLMYFAKKWFGLGISLLLGALIAVSPYFIFTSIFIGNNIFVLPVLVALIIINYSLIHLKGGNKKLLWLLAGLSLSLVFEFEVAYGLFLIPSYLIVILFNKKSRSNLFQKKLWLFFLTGLFIPLIPRLLFEIKNGFFQTKTILSFFIKPSLHNPKSLGDIFFDRLNLFWDYAKGIFSNTNIFYTFLFTLFVSLAIVFLNRKKTNFSALAFFSKLTIFLFLFTLLYKDNFWNNYYEGIQYIFLFTSTIILSLALNKSKLINLLIYTTLFITLFGSFKSVINDWSNRPKDTLLKNQTKVVDFITTQIKNQKETEYCVKVYTPPVIPFTYRYLFKHKYISQKIQEPKEDWVDRKCWYIIESDDNKERRTKWIEDYIPRKAKITEKKVFNDVEIRHYEIE